jgi:hypothetical protein
MTATKFVTTTGSRVVRGPSAKRGGAYGSAAANIKQCNASICLMRIKNKMVFLLHIVCVQFLVPTQANKNSYQNGVLSTDPYTTT